MSANAALDAALRDLAAEFGRMGRRIAQIEANQRTAQLGFASIENGALVVNDSGGNPQLQVGLQPDGTFAHVAVAATDQEAPSDPVVAPAISGLYVIWDGLMADGSAPLSDFDRLQVHVSAASGFTPDATTLKGYLDHASMLAVGGLNAGTPYYVLLVPLNTAQVAGIPSDQVTATPTAVADNVVPGSLTGTMIGDGEVTGSNIAQDTITADNIAAGTITANEIAAGTIAAANIAAGEVFAGIVDGSVINGAQFVVEAGGTITGPDYVLGTAGFLIYGGTPGAGNLIVSMAGAAGTDAFGNSYPQGFGVSAGAIPGGLLGTGTVTADKIASLTASLIGHLGVLNPNPYFTGGDGTGWAATNGSFSVTASPPAGAPFAFAGQYVNNGLAAGAMEETSGRFPAVPGAQYLVTAWVYSTTGHVQIGFDWRNSAGSFISASTQNFTVTPGTWTQVTTVQTSAAGTATGLPRVGASSADSGTTWAQAVVALPQVPGTLIQAGTVTAAQIAAGTITTALLSAGIVVAGIVDGTTITGAQIVADGSTGEFLAYDGTPAAGTLAASVSPVPGTDAEGNAYLANHAVYGQYISGHWLAAQTFVNNADGAGVAFYSATSEAGPWTQLGQVSSDLFGDIGIVSTLVSLVVQGGPNPAQVTIAAVSGFVPASPLLSVDGSIAFGGFVTVPPAGTGIASIGSDSTGYPVITDAVGMSLQVSGSKLANPAGAGPYPITVSSTSATSLGFMIVPEADVETGATYEIHAAGFFSTGTSAPSSATFALHWGGTSGTGIGSLQIPGAIAASQSLSGWYCDAEINFASTTEAVVTLKVGWHTATGVTGSASYFLIADTTGLVTNSGSKNLTLGFQWGSVPSGTSLVCSAFRAGRIA